MNTQPASYLLAVGLLCTACSSHLKVAPFAPATAYSTTAAATSPIYRLPETDFQVKASLKLFQRHTWDALPNGKPDKGTKAAPKTPRRSVLLARFSKPVTVAPLARPSDTLAFQLDLSEYEKNGVAVEELKLETEANGLLKGLNSTAGDQSATVTANVLTAVGTIAKFIAVAGPATVDETVEVPESETPFDRTYRLADFGSVGAGNSVSLSVPADDLKAIFAPDAQGNPRAIAEVPSLTLTLSEGAKIAKLKALLGGNAGTVTSATGIVVGLPGTAELNTIIDGHFSSKVTVPIAHLNGLQVIAVGNRKFNKRTVQIAVDPSLGSLTSYMLKSDSAASNATKLLADSAGTLKTLRDDLKTASAMEAKRIASADADALEATKRLMTAEQAVDAMRSPDPDVVETARLTKAETLLKAQTALAKAESESDPELLNIRAEKAYIEAQLDLLKKQKELADAQK